MISIRWLPLRPDIRSIRYRYDRWPFPDDILEIFWPGDYRYSVFIRYCIPWWRYIPVFYRSHYSGSIDRLTIVDEGLPSVIPIVPVVFIYYDSDDDLCSDSDSILFWWSVMVFLTDDDTLLTVPDTGIQYSVLIESMMMILTMRPVFIQKPIRYSVFWWNIVFWRRKKTIIREKEM